MTRYVFDSYAVIAFFKGEPDALRVERLLQSPAHSHFITTINVGEIFYTEAKRTDLLTAEEMLEDLYKLPLQLVDATYDLVMQAAQIKARHRLSYADCFAAALARRLDATLLTGDQEFSQVEDLVAIDWLKTRKRN